MKKLSIGSSTLAVIVSVVSILLTYGVSNAGELLDTSSVFRQASGMDTSPAMFLALDKMNTLEKQAGITPMTDDQLASIEAGVVVVVNVGTIVQNNIAVLTNNLIQQNFAAIDHQVDVLLSQ